MMILGDQDASPERTLVVLHGILGSAKNWRSFARRLASLRPQWRIVLVDLRNHGESPMRPGPHGVMSAAADLLELHDVLGGGPAIIAGHSFGGKVALAYAALRPVGLGDVWVIDAEPWQTRPLGGDGTIRRVFETLDAISMPVSRREEVRDAFIEAGLGLGVAGWMTTNLRRVDGGLAWRFDLSRVKEMLADYPKHDFTDWLGSSLVRVCFMIGAVSTRWDDTARQKLSSLNLANDFVSVEAVAGAGHWVHVDAPEQLLQLWASRMP